MTVGSVVGRRARAAADARASAAAAAGSATCVQTSARERDPEDGLRRRSRDRLDLAQHRRGSAGSRSGGRPRSRRTSRRAPAHLLEVELAVVGGADRPREQRTGRPGGTTTPQPTSATSCAVSLSAPPRRSPAGRRRGSRRGGSARRSRPARARARRRGCRRCESDSEQQLARLLRQEAHLVRLEPLARAAASSSRRAPPPMIRTARSSRSRRNVHGADQRVEVLRVADVAGVHDDEAPRAAGARAPSRCRAAAARRDVVSTQFGITRIRSGATPFSSSRRLIVSPIATTRSAERSDESTSAREQRDRRSGSRAGRARPRSRGRRPARSRAAARGSARRRARRDRADERRVGHAEDDVGPREREHARPERRRRRRSGSSRRAARAARGRSDGRADADDLDAVPRLGGAARPAARAGDTVTS